jgi:hypothetical protein
VPVLAKAKAKTKKHKANKTRKSTLNIKTYIDL